MKAIKSLTLLMGLYTVVLFAAGCDKGNETKRPKDLKPIDWENYNDVYTVYWNCKMLDCSQAGDTGNILKIEGWLLQPGANIHEIKPDEFCIVGEPNLIYLDNKNGTILIQTATPEIAEQMRIKFENSDLTRKCYIIGRFVINPLYMNGWCGTSPKIIMTDADNIIFE